MKSYQSANERGELLLDHVIITIKDLDRSIAFYETTLKSLGSVHALDYDGKPRGASGPQGLRTGPPRILLARQGDADARAACTLIAQSPRRFVRLRDLTKHGEYSQW
jgi:catechol 2,3-dioxygenase-like lactoylglutathione lyase family enzyme